MTQLAAKDIVTITNRLKAKLDIGNGIFEQLNEYLERNRLQNSYKVSSSGDVYQVMPNSQKKISNTFILPTGNKTIYHLGHEERLLEVWCLMNNKWYGPFSLTPKQLRNDQDWLRSFLGFESITWGKYTLIEECINLLIPLAPNIHEYAYVGWAKKHPGIYITGSGPIGCLATEQILPHPSIQQFNMPIPEIGPLEAVKAMFDVYFKVASTELVLPALSYSLLSCYKSLLEPLPQTPDFVLYIR